MNLNDVLSDEAKRASIVEEVCRLVDGEVGKQKGIGGVAVKAGYRLVQGVKPVRRIANPSKSSRSAGSSNVQPMTAEWVPTNAAP